MENTKEIPQIRPLTRKDRRTVSGIFTMAIIGLKEDSMRRVISADAPAAQTATDEENVGMILADIGISLLTRAQQVVDDEIGAWFADLLGVTIEEFDEMPVDVELNVLRQIRELPEADSFFTRAWQSAKMMSVFESLQQTMKERFPSIFKSEIESSTDTNTVTS